MALRSLCSLRLKTVVEYVVPCLERGLVDQSAYVRRNAIMGVLKLYHIEKDRVRESNLVTALQNLVLDEDADYAAMAAAERALRLKRGEITPLAEK